MKNIRELKYELLQEIAILTCHALLPHSYFNSFLAQPTKEFKVHGSSEKFDCFDRVL